MDTPELPVRSLEAILEDLAATSPALVLAPPTLLPALKDLTQGAEGGAHDLVVAVVDRGNLDASLAALRPCARPSVALMLVSRAPGLFGMGASGPDVCALTESLLALGAVEIRAAITPGALRKDLVVWGRTRGGARPLS